MLPSNNKKIISYIDKCVKLKCKLIKIHPFPDGNGRCSRALVDCLLISALLHDVYFEGPNRPSTLFRAREEFTPIARNKDLYVYGAIPEQVIDAVFQAIEEQMGDASEIKKLAPIPGGPADILATSIWIVQNYFVY